ncbi:MAG: biopolymer transporter ExbB, partial [Pseudomonadota bacterium]
MDREQEPQFSQPIRQILIMVIILGLVLTGSFFAYTSIAPIFLASPYLNGVILAVFAVGVLACFWQVLTLTSAVNWIEGFALDRPGHEFSASPRLLASLAALLRDTEARKSLIEPCADRVENGAGGCRREG